jgi:hypothetical protein
MRRDALTRPRAEETRSEARAPQAAGYALPVDNSGSPIDLPRSVSKPASYFQGKNSAPGPLPPRSAGRFCIASRAPSRGFGVPVPKWAGSPGSAHDGVRASNLGRCLANIAMMDEASTTYSQG